MPKIAALIVAAGRGSRFGEALPKQYVPLAGRPVLSHCLSTFDEHPEIDQICVVIHPNDQSLFEEAAQGIGEITWTPGGQSRQESVRLGLESLSETAPDLVLIHDGARPLLDRETIDRVISALADSPGAIAATPLSDSLKREENGRVAESVPRQGLWRAQTPQGFRYPDILAAHRGLAGRDDFTDDAAIATAAGSAVALVPGGAANIKITQSADLAMAERIKGLQEMGSQNTEYRSGLGFDVHRFESGDRVTLCGIAVPHDAKLKGHSDADVGLHALTDAILGAIGAGDIGDHFPPSDPRWAGADSARFLAHAKELVTERNGRIVNLDVTLICERPKIGPHKSAMVERIAQILDLAPERISVKATTTEELGFTGRREGIAAQATATIELPKETII